MFSPSTFLVLVADTPAQLRKCDLFRLFNECPPEHRNVVLSYVDTERPDLGTHAAKALLSVESDEAAATGYRFH